MFRIVCDPSSGSIELYLTEIRSGSLMFVACLDGVWQRVSAIARNYRHSTTVDFVRSFSYLKDTPSVQDSAQRELTGL